MPPPSKARIRNIAIHPQVLRCRVSDRLPVTENRRHRLPGHVSDNLPLYAVVSGAHSSRIARSSVADEVIARPPNCFTRSRN